MRILALIILSACFLAGCAEIEPAQPTTSASAAAAPTDAQIEELKNRMNDAFAGLEMYSADNSFKYPDNLDVLIPKYLDAIPVDPVSEKPIVYEKTEDGFQLGATGDYTGSGAEAGFPKMNQDGFYVKKAEEFPQEPSTDFEESPVEEKTPAAAETK